MVNGSPASSGRIADKTAFSEAVSKIAWMVVPKAEAMDCIWLCLICLTLFSIIRLKVDGAMPVSLDNVFLFTPRASISASNRSFFM